VNDVDALSFVIF